MLGAYATPPISGPTRVMGYCNDENSSASFDSNYVVRESFEDQAFCSDKTCLAKYRVQRKQVVCNKLKSCIYGMEKLMTET